MAKSLRKEYAESSPFFSGKTVVFPEEIEGIENMKDAGGLVEVYPALAPGQGGDPLGRTGGILRQCRIEMNSGKVSGKRKCRVRSIFSGKRPCFPEETAFENNFSRKTGVFPEEIKGRDAAGANFQCALSVGGPCPLRHLTIDGVEIK